MTADAARPSLAYSPALDGIRAFALIVVMLYHGGQSWLGGGFLAVDVFFVLSGFLITSLLLVEFEGAGRLDLVAFWGRRARRLLPALFLVLAAVLVYAAFLTGEAAASVRGDALATLFYVSNWWFIASGNSYFEQFQDPSPLTHTWTLAIEEQWYLLLPLALVVVLPRLRRSRLAWAFGALALLSALEMAWLANPQTDGSRVYYGTDTRLQSLLVGATLAVVLTPGVLQRIRPAANWIAPAALVGLMGFMILVSDQSAWIYTGGFLLFAGLSAALLASMQAHPAGLVARLFSLPAVVWVGKLSYGLYLWHWPVYVILSPARVGFSGVGLLALRFAVTFAVAVASYYLVEMPVRRGALSRFTSRQRVAVVLGAPLAIVAMIGVTTACSRPAPSDSLESIAASATRSPSAVPSASPVVGDVRAMLVGDSIPLSMYAAYRPGLVPGLSVLPGTEFGCGLVPFDIAVNGAKIGIRPECEIWEQQRAQRIASSGANLGVMFAGPWEQYDRWIDGESVPFTDPRWRDATVNAYARVIAELTQLPAQAVVLNSCHGAPELDLPEAAQVQAGRYPAVVNDPKRIAAVNDAAREAVRRSGRDIPIIDPDEFLCEDGQYRATIDGVQMHTDGVHFTEEGARLYWQWLGPRLLKAGPTPAATPSAPAG